jgi:hypothetical protein
VFGVDEVSGSCAHPNRECHQGLPAFVRAGELACRAGWGIDDWSPNLELMPIRFKVWGPYFPDELAAGNMPVDLLDWLVRNGRG